MENLHGSHYWLIFFPYWFLAVSMIFLGWGVLFLLRNFFERLGYDVSFASVIGDIGLIGIVMMSAEILKGQRVVSADWARSANFHYICAGAAILVGAFLLKKVQQKQGWFGEYADRYHNIVIVPALSYLIVTLLPVIYYQGSSLDKWATSFFLALWFLLVIFDSRTDDRKTNRLDQRAWLYVRGIFLPSSRPKSRRKRK